MDEITNFFSYIDHTLLKPAALLNDIERLCSEAVEYNFAAVCVPPPFVQRAAVILEPSSVKVATVVGFPLGYSALEAKLAETVLAIVDGADEVDMVVNLIALKNGDTEYLKKEIEPIAGIVHQKNKILKLIIETGILTDEEIIFCCRFYSQYPVAFLKTSTGYAEKGATVEAVKLMRANLPQQIGIKASGGIRDRAFAESLIRAGASRLGTSSAVQMLKTEN